MEKDQCFYLGKVARTHGLNGNVTVKLEGDDQKEYEGMESVFLEIQGKLVPFFINSISIKSNETAIVDFQFIDNEQWAKRIVGAKLYLPEEFLPELDESTFYFHEVEGFTVIDNATGNEIGTVKEIVEYPQHSVMSVMDGNKEILIPVSDDIFKNIDREAKVLYADLPEGLLDIYLEE